MDFVVSSLYLYEHLQLVSKVVGAKNTLPILDNLLFTVQDGELKVTGSDLETTITTNLKLDASEGNGTIALDTRKIIEVLKEFPEQPLTFNIDTETNNVNIISENGKFSLVGLNGEEFPQIPNLKPEKTTRVEMMPDIIFNGITSAIFATGQDELRPVMNGIFVEFLNDRVNFVATDAHKLVKYSRKEIKLEEEASFILPKKPAAILKSIVPKALSDIIVEFDDKNVTFSFDSFKLICRFVEGNYPKYNNVIPLENPNKVIIDRSSLMSSLRRVSLFSNQASNLVGLQILNNQLVVTAKDLDYSTSGSETISCSYNGDEMTIGFKSNFLIEILSNINASNVIIELSDPTRAGIVLPEVYKNPDEEVLMLLMPMMINN